MTWTWDPDQLASSQLMQVRAEIQDVDINNQLLSDQEIDYFGTVESDFWGTVAHCCEAIARGFLRKADVGLGRALQITYSKMSKNYFDMAKVVRAKALGTQVPWVGGMSVADKVLYLQNSDIVAALFTKTMMENPWTGGYTPDSLAPVGNSGPDAGGLDLEDL